MEQLTEQVITYTMSFIVVAVLIIGVNALMVLNMGAA